MPETKETFDWMAPIILRRPTRILQRVVRPGTSPAGCCFVTYYNAGLDIIVTTTYSCCVYVYFDICTGIETETGTGNE